MSSRKRLDPIETMADVFVVDDTPDAAPTEAPPRADSPAEQPPYLYLRWVGDGSLAVPGLPMGDVTLPYDEATRMTRTGLWEVGVEPTEN